MVDDDDETSATPGGAPSPRADESGLRAATSASRSGQTSMAKKNSTGTYSYDANGVPREEGACVRVCAHALFFDV